MKAILVVSFGTTHEDTRIKNIERLESEIARATCLPVYRAWTSKMIIERVRKKDGIVIDNVQDAMERIRQDGVTDVVVVSTHIINGIEHHNMLCDIKAYESDFTSIRVTTPLLTSDCDYERVCDILHEEYLRYFEEHSLFGDEYAIVLMGHGSEHFSNSAYAALDYRFKEMGHSHIFVGTVEAYPSVETVIQQVKHTKYRKIFLTPFMLVAGDHAKNDMASDEEDSWKCMFEREGYEVHCLVKGLGEYEKIRAMFIERIAMQE